MITASRSWISNAGVQTIRDDRGRTYRVDFADPTSFYDMFDSTLGSDFANQFVEAYESEFDWLKTYDEDINIAASACKQAGAILDRLIAENPDTSSELESCLVYLEDAYRFLCDYGASGNGRL